MLVFTVLSIFLLSNVALAAPTTQATPDKQSIQTSSTYYTQNELNQIRGIKDEVVKRGAVTLNTDGTITVNTNAAALGVDENIFKEYIQSVENINDIIKLGVVSFDKNFELKVKSQDEISKIIYQRDKELRQSGKRSNNRFDTQTANRFNIQSMRISSLPTLYAYYCLLQEKIP